MSDDIHTVYYPSVARVLRKERKESRELVLGFDALISQPVDRFRQRIEHRGRQNPTAGEKTEGLVLLLALEREPFVGMFALLSSVQSNAIHPFV